MNERTKRGGHKVKMPDGWEEVYKGRIEPEYMFFSSGTCRFEKASKWQIGEEAETYICIIKKVNKPIKLKTNRNPKGLSKLALIATRQ